MINTNNIYVITEVIGNQDCKLWKNITENPSHPLFEVVPAKKQKSLPNQGHNLILPAVKTAFFKRSFI